MERQGGRAETGDARPGKEPTVSSVGARISSIILLSLSNDIRFSVLQISEAK